MVRQLWVRRSGSIAMNSAVMAKVELRNYPKSLRCSCNVALWAAKEGLFAPFWPPYTSQIHRRSGAHIPFRTVSLRRSVTFVSKTNQRVEKLLHAPLCVPFKDLKPRFRSVFGLDF
jgi:hypothetical protein